MTQPKEYEWGIMRHSEKRSLAHGSVWKMKTEPVTKSARTKELNRLPKSILAALFIRRSGWVGGYAHPSKWRKDELVKCLLDLEFPESDSSS